MRYSDLAGKEIIDIAEGTRLGVVNGSDLFLDLETGTVQAIIMPQRGGLFSVREIVVPWHGVRKIGADFIIVDSSTIAEEEEPYRRPVQQKILRRKEEPVRVRHRVPGIGEEETVLAPALNDSTDELELFEDEAPQVVLQRLVNKDVQSSRRLFPSRRNAI